MHLVWSNCAVYNGKMSVIGKLGDRMESFFEQAWAASGLAHGSRARRANAGVAAAKYEPQLTPPEKAVPSGMRRTKSIASQQRNGRQPLSRSKVGGAVAGPGWQRPGSAQAAVDERCF
jgi:hypothetical protein